MYGTIIQQGSFITANAINQLLNIRSDVDWMQTRNMTTSAAGLVNGTAVSAYWQRGMIANDGIETLYNAAGLVVSTNAALATPGFNLINTSIATLGLNIAVTAGTNVVSPVYSTANTAGLAVGSIVRIYNTAHTEVNGFDFTISAVTPGVDFTLRGPLQQVPGAIAGAAGTYRMVAPDITSYNRWYPNKRVICNVTNGIPGANVVTTLVDHSLTTGQKIRFNFPFLVGLANMYELNGQLATVTVLNASTFTIDIDTTAYTPFVFPTIAMLALLTNGSWNPAEIIPVGVNPLFNTSLLDATINQDYLGMSLGYGVSSPAGVNGNVIYWVAGKSINM